VYTITAGDLIRQALLQIGSLAAGEEPTPAEAQDGLARLNQLIDDWSTQRLTMRVVVRATTGIVNGQADYTIGTGGDFNVPVVPAVDNCALLLNSSSPAVEIPLSPLTEMAYQAIAQKNLENTLPTQWYFEATIPRATVTLWPVPTDDTNDLVIYYPTILAQFTDLTTGVQLAPAYARALRTNLAVELAPEFGRSVSGDLRLQAAESLGTLKRNNASMMDLGVDPGLTFGGRPSYNIYTDTGG
jgi:hypothetical protein